MMRRARRITLALAAIVMIASSDGVNAAAGPAQESPPRDPLRARIEARYEIIPLRDAIGLRPKNPAGRIRMIEVSDEGRGFAGMGSGYGLVGMRERAAGIGGRLEVVSTEGRGTTVFLFGPN